MTTKYIQVGAHTYELDVSQNDAGDCGETDYIKSRITINRDMTQSMKESTLLHEAMHACNTTMGEEQISHALLDSLAEQLYHFLDANGLLNKKKLSEILCA